VTTTTAGPEQAGAGAGHRRDEVGPKAPPGVHSCLLAKTDEGRSPKGSPHLFKADASNTAGRFDFMAASFAPLTGPPLHLHREQDDTFYVLEGILTVQVVDDLFELGPGDFLSIPPGLPHAFENLHNEGKPVRAINLMTPGGFFDMFNEMGDVPAGPEHSKTLSEVAERHGTLIVGPPLRVILGLG
jgi:mannose-6-phosphate isomerase-like protein (cupin superfamily)